MQIIHDQENRRFHTTIDGLTSAADYRLSEEGLEIMHTFVPEALKGRGIASALVASAYDYATANNLRCLANCSYAAAWLIRHPAYTA